MSLRGSCGTVDTGFAHFDSRIAGFACTEHMVDADCRAPAGVDYDKMGLDELSVQDRGVSGYILTSLQCRNPINLRRSAILS